MGIEGLWKFFRLIDSERFYQFSVRVTVEHYNSHQNIDNNNGEYKRKKKKLIHPLFWKFRLATKSPWAFRICWTVTERIRSAHTPGSIWKSFREQRYWNGETRSNPCFFFKSSDRDKKLIGEAGTAGWRPFFRSWRLLQNGKSLPSPKYRLPFNNGSYFTKKFLLFFFNEFLTKIVF